MRSRPISVFTIYHSDNAKTEISSRLLEIMEESKLLLMGWQAGSAFFYLSGSFIFIIKLKVISIASLTCSPFRAQDRLFLCEKSKRPEFAQKNETGAKDGQQGISFICNI